VSRKHKLIWREYLKTAIIAAVVAVILRIFVISAYRVGSASMEDTLLEGDFLFVDQLFYGELEVGNIIVFKYPDNPEKDLIKRVVALPNDTVEIIDKKLYVNGKAAALPAYSKYIDSLRVLPKSLSFRDNFGSYVVPESMYFVMGDNRDDSRDSRFWGSVPKEDIKGKAVLVYWSWQPDPNAPEWELPYVVSLIEWIGYLLWNFPSHLRWGRLGNVL